MDNEQPHQELVKCVIVGDTAVGKTRLVCARACNKHVSLSQLLSTHVPTVWAIDQYRIYKDVLERSWDVVDGVNVSLRLWDTFGDHDKDRRFAYGRSDVVLLCFSIANQMSLKNCRTMWYQEIRKFCPETPVILVGCKNDMRYMYRDQAYLAYFDDKTPFVRPARKSDLVMPEEARAVARELGITYYETSVFTYFGVNEVFENAVRAALISRRHQRFWMTSLKRVQRPLLQAPFRPPKPLPPEVTVLNGNLANDMLNLYNMQRYTDLTFTIGNIEIHAHRFIVASGSHVLNRLLNIEFNDMARSSSESSMVSSNLSDSAPSEFNDDTEYLIRATDAIKFPQRMWDHLKKRSSYQALSTIIETKKSTTLHRDLNHPAFYSIQITRPSSASDLNYFGSDCLTTITISKLITAEAMHECLKFIYSGTICNDAINVKEVRQAAELLELEQLKLLLANRESNEDKSVECDEPIISNDYQKLLKRNLEKHCSGNGSFSDLTFELDDGQMKAHRSMLITRCDVMCAMLTGEFREAFSKVIVFPGVSQYTFHKLLCYLYTDEIPKILSDKCINLLEIANRLCLPRMLNLIECRIIEDLTKTSQPDICKGVELCLSLLEPAKLHNAHQLADWCMSFLCVNFNVICRTLPKTMKTLHPDNQDYLREHRWPPVWYLKDYDYYQRCLNEQNRNRCQGKRQSNNDNGCLCFSGGGKSRRIQGVLDLKAKISQRDAEQQTESLNNMHLFNSNVDLENPNNRGVQRTARPNL